MSMECQWQQTEVVHISEAEHPGPGEAKSKDYNVENQSSATRLIEAVSNPLSRQPATRAMYYTASTMSVPEYQAYLTAFVFRWLGLAVDKLTPGIIQCLYRRLIYCAYKVETFRRTNTGGGKY